MRMRMHGWRAGEEEDRQRKRHMWTVPPRGSPILDALAHGAATASYSPNSTTFFSKDGRKISVGDCALFLPPKDCPPFIGIIRSVTVGKENKLTLSVNWLYRPAEVKLGKCFPLEAAPNEIFYSFHKDEIPAASLLHPCKVAFLPKGVELPSGIVSFVCRKVYDITKQCLWWLTDKDYMTDRQEEIDQLLYKTRVEMHATVPPGGRSPKPMNGPTSTSQLKLGSDSVQNSASSYPSQVKGKKRERGDQVSEPVKRERSSRMEDGDSGHNRTESLKFEIAKFTDKGGVVDYDGVEKLVQLMMPEKKIDLVCRSMLAGVVAATDNNDCLNWFVQLKGLPVYDEWLQDVHKGKIGDGNSPKDSDKSIEEFLLILLRALDKLPINLHALQMCNIGKSVNCLRTHKNLEIQKKARSLVDTWKKRVEAEMDAKPNQAVSWPAKPRLPEATPGGNRQSGGFSEVSVNSSLMQPTASKTSSVKHVPGETTMKSAFASPVSVKSATSPTSVGTNLKDGQSRNSAGGGATDLPSTLAKDEKSSGAGQSHNNTHSCSIDHAKTGGCSGKEDARSSTAASVTANKTSGSSRPRKSVNGFPCSNLSGVQRETGSNRTSQHRNQASERPYQSSLTSDKAIDVSAIEGSNHKLVVKIPNRGHSPAQSASAGSLEDPPVTNSIASSPILSEKQDQFDCNLKEKNDTLLGVDEGDGAPSVAPEEEGCQTDDDTKAFTEITKDASLPSGNEHKNTKRQQIPFSALVKYSAVAASVPVGDDIGMNLLASVAAGEMCKSDVVSPDVSPRRNTPVHDQLCDDQDSSVKSSPGADLSPEQSQSIDGADDEHGKQVDPTLPAKNADTNLEKSARDLIGQLNISPMDLPQTRNSFQERSENLKQDINEEISDAAAKYLEGEAGSRVDTDGSPGAKQKISSSLLTVDRVSESVVKVEAEALEGSASYRSLEIDGETKKNVNDGFNNDVQTEQKLSPVVKHFVKGTDTKVLHMSGPSKDLASENVDEVNADNADEVDVTSHLSDSEKRKTAWRTKVPLTHEDQNKPNSGLDVPDHKCEHIEETVESNEGKKHHCAGPAPPEASSALQVQETGQLVRLGVPKLTGDEVDEAEVSSSTTADVSFSAGGVTDMEAKVEFDLNENFSGDDGKYGESNHLTAPDCSGTAQQLISPLPFPVSSVSSSLLASITVAAAAKGPFVPPEDLMRSKGALGWKGSAATSAFRPAEPRKVLEMPLGATNIALSNATPGKHSRPPLDIDLNVPDERIFADLVSRGSAQDTFSVSDLTNNRDVPHERMGSTPARCSGGLDLDLNRVEELTDGNISTSNGHKAHIPVQPVTTSSVGLFNGEVSVRRDFDLNDGPVVDEMTTDPALFNQNTRSIPPQPPVSGLRMNTADTGNLASWYPRGNTYSTVTVPSLPDREQQPFSIFAPGAHQRILTPPSVGAPFVPDVFRGPVLSSSPAIRFPSTHFQYPIFPFGATIPLPSATFSGGSTTYVDSSSGGRLCFPAMNSQILGPTPAVPSHYPRPYVGSLPDGSNNSNTEIGWKWGRQGLDLNAGPGVPDIEGRDETLPLVPRQLSVASSQALAEEQARIYHVPGGVLKRKEPEGWDGYKRPSWQ